MKVAIVGGFSENYTVGLEWSYLRAFRDLGYEVHAVQERSDVRLILPRRVNQFEEWARLLLEEEALIHRCQSTGAELVLIIKGRCVNAKQVRQLRASGQTVVNIVPDNPFEAAASGVVARRLLEQYRALDLVLVHDRFAVGQLRQMGVRAEYIAFARDPEIHAADLPVAIPKDAPAIVFVGNPDSERIRYLRAVSDLGLALFGTWEWAKLPPNDPLVRCVRGEVQLGPDMVRAMRNARLCVNVLRHSQKTAHNMRTFETPACGGCTVSEASIGVEEHMRGGHEVALFRTPEELRTIAKSLLAAPSHCLEIALAGYERVRGETYTKRATEVIAMMA